MKSKIIDAFKAVGRTSHRALVAFGAFLAFCLFCIIFGQVILRSLRSATAWAEEAAQFILISVVFLGAAAVQGQQGHVKVDFLLVRFPSRIHKMIRILIDLLLIFSLGSLLVGVLVLAPYVSNLTTPGGGIPLWWMYLVIAIGLTWWVSLVFRSLWLLLRYGTDHKGIEL